LKSDVPPMVPPFRVPAPNNQATSIITTALFHLGVVDGMFRISIPWALPRDTGRELPLLEELAAGSLPELEAPLLPLVALLWLGLPLLHA
jgi:hypothetical protein